MDIRQLRYFVKIVELQNMTAAANALHVAQSSLSHHISNLEAHFGVKLLLREARGVQCTPAGTLLYEHAQIILRQIEHTEAAVRHPGLAMPDSVLLGMPRSEAPLLAPRMLEILAQSHPQLTLTIVEDSPSALSQLLADQKIDVALLADVHTQIGFNAQHLVTEELLLIGTGHATGSTPLPVQTLAELPFILPRAPSSIRDKVDSLCKALSLPYRVVAESASIAVALGCVKAGICWSILPWAALSWTDEDRGFHHRQIEGCPLKRELYVCMSANAISSPSANIVRELLVDMIRQMVDDQSWAHVQWVATTAMA